MGGKGGSRGCCKPTSGSRAKPRCEDWGRYPLNNFSAYGYKTRKLAHKKKEILILFSATSATDMFTIQRIVFLDISIKGRFESNKCLLLIKSKITPFFYFKKMFLYLYKKRIDKKLFSKSETIIQSRCAVV